jgi:hypothetical protein
MLKKFGDTNQNENLVQQSLSVKLLVLKQLLNH